MVNSGFSASFTVPSHHRKTVAAEVAGESSAASWIVLAEGRLTASLVPRSRSFALMCAFAVMAARKREQAWMIPLCVSPDLNAYIPATNTLRRSNARSLLKEMPRTRTKSSIPGPAEAKRRSVQTRNCRTPRSEMRPIRQRGGSLCVVNFPGCQGSDWDKTRDGPGQPWHPSRRVLHGPPGKAKLF